MTAAAALSPITFVAEPETTASPENENQRAPDLTFDNGALAEHNRALKRKPQEAPTNIYSILSTAVTEHSSHSKPFEAIQVLKIL